MTATASQQPAETPAQDDAIESVLITPFAGSRVAPAVRSQALPSWSWGAMILIALGAWCLFVALGYGLYHLLFS